MVGTGTALPEPAAGTGNGDKSPPTTVELEKVLSSSSIPVIAQDDFTFLFQISCATPGSWKPWSGRRLLGGSELLPHLCTPHKALPRLPG